LEVLEVEVQAQLTADRPKAKQLANSSVAEGLGLFQHTKVSGRVQQVLLSVMQ
jgi:hypothetical protein